MSDATRARWARELEARARAHWTEARTEALLRGKGVRIRPAEGAILLRAIGLLDGDAAMPPARVRKYFQINHMVGVLEPAFQELRARHPRITVLDAGCGRSYLSLLLAWCGKHVWQHPIEIVGVDRNPDVIEECRRRAALAELDDVARFEAAPLEQFDPAGRPIHAVLALHACDTATCDALALGVALGAELLAVAPCCQAELARGWAARAADATPGALAPIWRTPHLRRAVAADVTDAMRTLLLRAAGYEVTAIEFVGSEHTRKNTLIRARRAGGRDAAALAEYHDLVDATGGVGLALAERLT
jgi:SAM-dependent methyltransferase